MSETMQTKLKAYLGIKHQGFDILLRIVIFSIIFLFGLFIISKSIIMFALFTSIVLIGFVVYYIIKYKRLDLYYYSIAIYYQNLFKDYQDMNRVFTYYKGGTAVTCKKNVLFFFDGYYFYLFEDLLVSTGLKLPRRFKTNYNPIPLFKIYDENVNTNICFSFKLKDILSYKLVGSVKEEIEHKVKEEFCHVFDNNEINNYVIITFNDFKTIQIGANVYPYLKEILPLREVTDEE